MRLFDFFNRGTLDNSTIITDGLLDLNLIRVIVLNGASWGVSYFGAIALASHLLFRVSALNKFLVIVYGLSFLWLLIITFFRKLNFRFRAASLNLLILLVGFTVFLIEGLSGNGRIYLVIVPVATTILFGVKAGFWSLLVNWFIFGVLALLGRLSFIPLDGSFNQILPGQEPAIWSSAFAGFLLATGSLYAVLRVLFLKLDVFFDHHQNLSLDLQAERSQLERRVTLSARDNELSLTYCKSSNNVIKKIMPIQDPLDLQQAFVDLIQTEFNLYFAGIYEVDKTGGHVVLKNGSGALGKLLLANDHRLAVNSKSSVGWAILNQKVRLSNLSGQEALQFKDSMLPETRSELAIPIRDNSSSEQNLELELPGVTQSIKSVLSLQSSNPLAFKSNDIHIFEDLVAGFTIALDNAGRFKKNTQNIAEIRDLHLQPSKQSSINRGMFSYSTESIHHTLENDNIYNFSVPIQVENQVVGMISLENDITGEEVTPLKSDDIAFVEQVAKQAALALENARLLEETHRHYSTEHFLSNCALKARSSNDLETILQLAVKEIGQGLGASESIIQLKIPAIDLDENSNREAES